MPDVGERSDIAELSKDKMGGAKDEGLEVDIETSKVELKRELGLPAAISMVVGSTIGSGIFVSPSVALKAAGSVGLTLTFWVVVGLATMLGSLCYSELGTLIPKSGGTYTYLKMGVGNFVAFAYIAQSILFQAPGGLVVVLGTCSRYLVTMFPTCGTPVLLEKTITVTIIVGLFLVNMRSSKLAARLMIFTTNAKVIALIVVIVGGIVSMCKGITSELGTGFAGSNTSPASLTMTFFACSWAYGGGDNLNNVVEEIKNPARNIPIAQIAGIILIMGVYLMTNISYFAVLTVDEMLTSTATAVAWGKIVLGPAVFLIPLSVAMSTLGAGTTYFFSGSRVTFTAARDRNIPDVISYIQVQNLTPMVAITLTMAMAIVLVMPSDIADLINYIGFLGAFFRGCVIIALLRFRYTLRDVERPFKVPLIIPIAILLVQVFLFVTPLVQNPKLEFVFTAVGMFGLAFILYVIFIKLKVPIPFYDSFVKWIQLIFQVTPPADFDDDILFKAKKDDEKTKEQEIK